MKQQQLAAYLGLIEDLLSCPQGEEWIHLKRHEPLVDAQFVEVMEQVAAQLNRQGNPQAAIFLHNWAAKLHHIFFKEVPASLPEENSSEAYLTFIEKLLSCPEGLEEDLIVEHKSLIGPGLVHQMREVSEQLIAQQEIAAALSLDKFADKLKQMWISEHDFQPQFQKKPKTEAPAEKMTAEKVVAKSDAVDRELVDTPEAPDMSEQANEIDDPWRSDSTDKMAEPDAVSITDHLTDSEDVSVSELEATPSDIQGAEAIADGLNAIAAALQQLNQTLSSESVPQRIISTRHHTSAEPSSPLAHLEALERAYEANWQLTTEEVEKLIGVRPRCHEKETVYQRGNWRFDKVGQLGNQIAWQVSKISAN